MYDERGVLEYRRLDAVRDPHDLLAHDGGWLVVSSGTNEIVHVGPDELRVVWHRDGEPDAWHVNCLVSEGDDIWLSAFGEFTIFKEWRDRAAVGRGMITNLRTGESIGGLTHPHSPRLVDGSWLICESLDGLLVRRDRSGAKVAEQDLGGYTAGWP